MDEREEGLGLASKWLVLMTLLAGAGLCLSGLLSYYAFVGHEFVRGERSDCNAVLYGVGGKFLDAMPLAMLGMGAYIIVLIGLMLVGQSEGDGPRRLGWRILLVMGVGLGGASLWQMYLQMFEIGLWCVLCMVLNGMGLWLCYWVFGWMPRGQANGGLTGGGIVGGVLVGLLLLVGVIFGTYFVPSV